MDLKTLIKRTNWQDVCKSFLFIYPDQNKSILGYEIVYNKLRKKNPTVSKMELCFQKHDTDDSIDVYGVNGTTRDNGSLEHYSLCLSPWSQWLGSSISQNALSEFSNEEIISHCLFEMTFHGFTEVEIKNVGKRLDQSVQELESPIRYVILSNIFVKRSRSLYFNISQEVWCSDLDSATLFKNIDHAQLILNDLKEGKKDGSNLIAKLTTKNNSRKILKYYD